MTCDSEICLTEDGKSKFPISIFIERQLPRWAAIDHPKFVRFLEAYYEWMETAGTGEVLNFVIDAGGSDYSPSDTVTIKSTTGTGFTGTLVVQSGKITGITIVTAGSGYVDGVVDIDSSTGYGAKITPIFSKNGAYASKYCLKDSLDIDRTVDEFLEFFRREYLHNIPRDLYESNKCVSATPFATVDGKAVYNFDLAIPRNADITVTIDGVEVDPQEYEIGDVTNQCNNTQSIRFSDDVVNDVGFAGSEVKITACENVKVNERLLIKTIKDMNVKKGTEASYRFLFNILFNEDIEIKYPNQNLLITSDGKWQRGSDINVTSTFEFECLDGIQRDYSTGIRFDIEQANPQLTVKPNNQYNLVGTWNAETNTPFLQHGIGTNGDTYIVGYGGLANLDPDPENPISGETLLYIEGDKITYSASANRWIRIGQNDFRVSEEVIDGDVVNVLHVDSEIPIAIGDRFVLSITKRRLTGSFSNEDGKLSSTMLMQDGKKYQQFSYIIRSERTLDQYADYVKRLLHPAGLEMFGEIAIEECISFLIQDFWYTREIEPKKITSDNLYDDENQTAQLGPRWRSFDMHKFEYGVSALEFYGQNSGWQNTQEFNFMNQVIGEIIDEPEKKINFLIDGRMVTGEHEIANIPFGMNGTGQIEFAKSTIGFQDLGQFVYDLSNADITPAVTPSTQTIIDANQLMRIYPVVYNKQEFTISYVAHINQTLYTNYCDETQTITLQDVNNGYVQFGLDSNGAADSVDLSFQTKETGAYGDSLTITTSVPATEGVDFEVDRVNNRIILKTQNGQSTWVDIGANFQYFIQDVPKDIGTLATHSVFCSVEDSFGNIYIGGDFNSIGSVSGYGGIAKWNFATNSWEKLGFGVNVPTGTGTGIYNMDFDSSGNLYVAGNFLNARNTSASDVVPNTRFMAKYNTSSNLWESLTAPTTDIMSVQSFKYNATFNGFVAVSNIIGKSFRINVLVDVGTANERWCTLQNSPDFSGGSLFSIDFDSTDKLYCCFGNEIQQFTLSSLPVFPSTQISGTWSLIADRIPSNYYGHIACDRNTDELYYYNLLQYQAKKETHQVLGGEVTLAQNPLSNVLNTVSYVRNSSGMFISSAYYSIDYPTRRVIFNPLYVPDGTFVDVYYKVNGDEGRYYKYDIGLATWSALSAQPTELNNLATYNPQLELNFNHITNELYVSGASSLSTIRAVWKYAGAVWSPIGNLTGNVEGTMIYSDGTVYSFGSYNTPTSEPYAKKFSYFDGSNWRSLTGFVETNANIHAIDIDSLGNIYVGGSFTHIDGVRVNNIAMYDGLTWNALGGGVNSAVYALKINALDEVFVGGTFNAVDYPVAITAQRAAMWNGAWNALGDGLGITNTPSNFDAASVGEIAIDGTDVYFVGNFKYAFNPAAVATDNIAKWNGASWSSCGGSGGLSVRDVKVRASGDIIFSTRDKIFSTDGFISTLEHTLVFSNPISDSINSIEVDGSGDIYIGGLFYGINGSSIDINGRYFAHFAKWNGSSWESVGNGVDSTVLKLKYNALLDAMFLTGQFGYVDQDQYLDGAKVAAYSFASGEWLNYGLGFNNMLIDIAFDSSNSPIVVGNITSDYSNTKPFHFIARFDASWGVGSTINITQNRYMYLPANLYDKNRISVYHSRNLVETTTQTQFVATGGETTVAITQQAPNNTYTVLKNSVQIFEPADFSVSGSNIVLTTALTVGDTIDISFDTTYKIIDERPLFEPLITNNADEDYVRSANTFYFTTAFTDSTTEYHTVTSQNIADGYIQLDGYPFEPDNACVDQVVVYLGVTNIPSNHATYAWEIQERTRRILLTGSGWINVTPIPVGQVLEITYPRLKQGDKISIEYLGQVSYLPVDDPQNVIEDFDGLQIYYSGRVAASGFPADEDPINPTSAYENLQNLQLVNKTYIPDNKIVTLPLAVGNLTENEPDSVTYPEVLTYPYHILANIIDVNKI